MPFLNAAKYIKEKFILKCTVPFEDVLSQNHLKCITFNGLSQLLTNHNIFIKCDVIIPCVNQSERGE